MFLVLNRGLYIIYVKVYNVEFIIRVYLLV